MTLLEAMSAKKWQGKEFERFLTKVKVFDPLPSDKGYVAAVMQILCQGHQLKEKEVKELLKVMTQQMIRFDFFVGPRSPVFETVPLRKHFCGGWAHLVGQIRPTHEAFTEPWV